MKVVNETYFCIERKEGRALLKVYNHMLIENMKMYGTLDAFLNTGRKLKVFERHPNLPFIKIPIEDFYGFAVNMITNTNLLSYEKLHNMVPNIEDNPKLKTAVEKGTDVTNDLELMETLKDNINDI